MGNRVSIIIPIYNVEHYLRQCVDSVLNQTYRDLEVILINDGSKDRSLEISNSYAAKDSRVVVIDKPNEGVAATRNVGLSRAHGDYVLFVDSDDWIETDMVEFLVSQAVSTGCPVVTCDRVLNDELVKNDYSVYVWEPETVIEQFLYHKKLFGSLWNKLFKRSLLHGLTFDNEVSYGEDALFCWQVFKRFNERLLMTDRQLYHYRMNEGSISHSFGKLKFTSYKVWQTITDDTTRLYPSLLPIAQASFCSQMTIVLFDAAINGYRYDENIERLQKVVRGYGKVMRKQPYCSNRKYVSSVLLCHQYSLLSRCSFVVDLFKRMVK